MTLTDQIRAQQAEDGARRAWGVMMETALDGAESAASKEERDEYERFYRFGEERLRHINATRFPPLAPPEPGWVRRPGPVLFMASGAIAALIGMAIIWWRM